MTGSQLKWLRRNAMLSQIELGALIGVAQGVISEWEHKEEPLPEWWEDIIRREIKNASSVKASAVSIEAPKIKPRKPEKIDDSLCRAGCVHWRPLSFKGEGGERCCHYILDTKKKRPCPPGKKCTVFNRAKRKRKRWNGLTSEEVV